MRVMIISKIMDIYEINVKLHPACACE